jgi:hypothetical protein
MSRPARITTQQVEHNVKMQRLLDVQRHQLSLFANENNKLLSEAKSQAKVEIKRRQAEQQACRKEMEYERNILDEQKQNRINARVLSQNAALAEELDREAAEQQRREREIQRICDEAPELKDLEKQLKIAYLNKERAAQHEELVLLSQKEQERIQAIEDQMEYDRQMAIKNDGDKKGAKKEMYDDQRRVLQKQIREKEELLAEAKRQTEFDRKTVDEIVQKINNEDAEEARMRREKQRETAEMVRKYELQRQEEVRLAKEKARLEEEEIKAYNDALAARGAGVEAAKQAKQDEADRMLAKIVEETEKKRRAEEEFNDLRDMLWAEELEHARAQDAQARKDKSYRMRQEMMAANETMLKAKAEQRIRDAENEARMIGLMKKKFAEDEAKERAAEDNRRKNKAHHMTLVEEQRRQRETMYNEEKEAEMEADLEAGRREAYRKQVIAEARKRLIEEHSSKLKGFMPKSLQHQ